VIFYIPEFIVAVRYSFILVFFIGTFFSGFAQEEKKISFNLMGGVALLTKSEKLLPSGLPENIFGGYKPGIAAGAGINYRLSEKMYLFENVSVFHTSKTNFGFSLNTFRTGLKYNFLSPEKRFSPFVAGSLDLALVFLNRAKNSRDILPDSTANSIGSGFGATKITYNEEQLKLSAVPLAGASIGAGMNFRLSPRFSIFLLYTINHNLARQSKLLKDNYFYNKANLNYGMATAGLTMRIFKKTRQLLATLPREKWEGDNTASLKGLMIYKKDNTSKKPEMVEMTNQKDSTLSVIPGDKEGIFKIADVPANDYKFYLLKRNSKIAKADIELIHDNRLKLTDDYLTLEMIEEPESENFISREGNYSVVLREGFQHEINLSITGLSINGKLDNIKPDTSCQRMQLLLYDKRDSLIRSSTPMADCSFNFTDLVPGAYKMVVRNKEDGKIKFTYGFNGSQPVVSSQYNSMAPKLIYMIAGKINITDSAGVSSKEVMVKLIDPVSRVVKDTALTQNGKFRFGNLPSDQYTIVYEPDPKIQGNLEYTIDDNEETYHNEYSYNFGASPKEVAGEIAVEGKLKTRNPDRAFVYLITNKNEVRAKTRPDADGKFTFTHLPSKDFKVVYQLEDSNMTAKLNYDFIDESELVEETFVLSAKGTKDVGVKQKIQGNDLTKKPADYVIERDNAKNFDHMEIGNTYNSKGQAVKAEGFGIQVASYVQLDNLKRQYTKLQNAGITDAYIQVVNVTEKGKKVKYYRIVVGAHKDLNDLRERDLKLKEQGYTTTYRKHL
jgi:hypothetical protein